MKRIALATIAAAALFAASGCSSPTDSTDAVAVDAATTTTSLPAATTTTPAKCDPAPDRYVTAIDGSFNDSALSLGPAYAVTAPGGLTYIGAHVMDGDERESSADVWVAQGAVVFALSGSARDLSMLPDGRTITGASAGDEYGSQVQNCTIGR